ncbi:dihydrofolate reductase-like [Anneissia japonica]|uniref:dihydrofolate reductase-like n=1 Tax=Anneissia japonica TaxID=1529436 RepID=UPI0014256FAF|nr:dihydrofolate reductase-like [Anneissia japonica]
MALKKFNIIVAVSNDMGIGLNGDLPWRLRKDMKQFSLLTSKSTVNGKNNAVVMGRRTWDSIPEKFRPLPNRVNVVLSRTLSDPPPGADYLCGSLDKAMALLSDEPLNNQIDLIWIIGGSEVYKEAMMSPLCHQVYITRVSSHVQCDAFFPNIDKLKYKQISLSDIDGKEQEERGIKFRYEVYQQINN